MCFNQKCLFCIPVEVGSLILGVFTSIINLLGIFCCIGGLVYVNVFLYEEQYTSCVGSYCASVSYNNYPSNRQAVSIATNAGLSVGLALFLMDFAFSVALADGANKKKAGHIKTYFIYGVVKSVLASIADIIFVVNGLWPAAFPMTICIIIYALLLVMVYQTRTKFTCGSVYAGLILKNEDQVQLV